MSMIIDEIFDTDRENKTEKSRRPHLDVIWFVPIHKWLFFPIRVLCSDFNPQNNLHIQVVKIFACLELEKTSHF